MFAKIFTLGLLLPATFGIDSAYNSADATCHSIAEAISSSSAVYYPGSSQYTKDLSHWSSTVDQNATCSVEPSTSQDVAIILNILGKSRTPFAVKGGGHSPNPGFSATKGVHVSMTRFSTIAYDNATQTVELGAGLTWQQVYEALEPFSVNVVGGRVATVGVAGYLLGGGLSYKSNQYGLAMDTVLAFELVLPNGTVTSVTADDDDLWFGLRGGFNNFGIVTKFTMKAFPQTDVWGGYLIVPSSGMDALLDAAANWSANASDPKAAINTAFIYDDGEVLLYQLLFYDAPTPPSGLFDEFTSIPGANNTATTQSYLSLVNMGSTVSLDGTRSLFNAASAKRFTKAGLQIIAAQTKYWGDILTNHSAVSIFNVAETFLPTMFSHGTPSAYPPARDLTLCPINLYVGWTDPSADTTVHNALAASAANMTEPGEVLYTNYALGDVPVKDIYGDNVGRLGVIKRMYDPGNVMGLAGGYKF